MPKAKRRAKPKAKPGPELRIAEAALHLIARHGWERLTLEAVARAAKLPAAQVKKSFPDTYALLPGIVRLIDTRMNATLEPADSRASLHDRLFETLMARFDVLQANRRAIANIMDAAKRDPRMIRHLLPAQAKAMRGILNHTGLKPEPLYEFFIIAGLLGIYGSALCVWRLDSSQDMAKTMAALDRMLRRAGTVSDILLRRSFKL